MACVQNKCRRVYDALGGFFIRRSRPLDTLGRCYTCPAAVSKERQVWLSNVLVLNMTLDMRPHELV
jgi:hypothetical protein